MTAVIPGEELIAIERRRQIAHEHYDAAHDDEHTDYELVRAAACYAKAAHGALLGLDAETMHGNVPDTWPWNDDYWRPSADPIRNLEKAGALIAAEIDRLQRMAPPMLPRAIEHTPSVSVPLRMVLDLFMANDPSSFNLEDDHRLEHLLDAAAERYGYSGWVAAFHDPELKS